MLEHLATKPNFKFSLLESGGSTSRKDVDILKRLKTRLPTPSYPCHSPRMNLQATGRQSSHAHGLNKGDMLPFYLIQILHPLDAGDPRQAAFNGVSSVRGGTMEKGHP